MNEKEPAIIDIEYTRSLEPRARMICNIERQKWLKRQRKQDKKDLKKQIHLIDEFKWTKKGLCPACKEHEIIYKAKRCLKCYGKLLKKQRKKTRKKRNIYKYTKQPLLRNDDKNNLVEKSL
jgi:hypothetical protein